MLHPDEVSLQARNIGRPLENFRVDRCARACFEVLDGAWTVSRCSAPPVVSRDRPRVPARFSAGAPRAHSGNHSKLPAKISSPEVERDAGSDCNRMSDVCGRVSRFTSRRTLTRRKQALAVLRFESRREQPVGARERPSDQVGLRIP